MSQRNIQRSLDETGLLIPTPGAFMHIPTLWLVALECIVFVAFEVLLFITFPGETETDEQLFSIASSAHVAVSVFAVLCYFFMNRYSRKALTHGYITIYRRSKFPLRLGPVTFATGNAFIILWHNWGSNLSQMMGIQIIFSIELACVIPALLYYGSMVWKHNSAKAPPDNGKELASSLRMSLLARLDAESGSESYFKDLADRQTEMVRHLQHQKENLSRQVVSLNERLRQYEKTSYANSSEDIKLLIESKDQEIRAMKGHVSELEASLEKANQIQLKEEAVVLDKKVHDAEKQQLEAEIKRKNEETNKLRLMYEVSKDANEENQHTINQLNAEIALLKQQLNSIYGGVRT